MKIPLEWTVKHPLTDTLTKVKFEKSVKELNSEADRYVPEMIKNIIYNFDWEFLESFVEDNKGYAKIKVITYDFGEMLLDSSHELLFKLLSLDNNQEVTSVIVEVLVNNFVKKWAICHTKNFEKNVVLSFTFDGEKWLVNSLSDDAVDKLLGGFYSAAKSIVLDKMIEGNYV